MQETALLILKTLNDNGFKAYIVGGYPRDCYLKRKSIDIDICTSATPKDIQKIFNHSILSKEQYGSVTIIENNIRFEITTFRKEMKYENNRFPVKIKYVDNLIEDLKRRDFIINTLCMDKEGNVIDLLEAKQDIDNQLIQTVGNADKKIKEDILRSLRAIRFATVLNFTLDNKLKDAIKKHRKLLKNLSFYRKKEELDKIFASTNAAYGISLLQELDLFPSLSLSFTNDLVVTTCALGIWAQFASLKDYSFSAHEKEIIQNIKKVLQEDVCDNYTLYKYGLYICTIAGEIKKIDRSKIVTKYNNLPIFSRKDINITVKNICDVLNKKPGCFIKDIMADIEKNILNGVLNNNHLELINYVKETCI